MRSLFPCPSCARHVRSDERTCPFCDAALSPDFAAPLATRIAGQPLSRAALVFATAAAMAGTACGKEPSPPKPAEEAHVDAALVPVTVYGPPPQRIEVQPVEPPDAAGAPEKGKR